MARAPRDAQLPSGFRTSPLARVTGGHGCRLRLADGRDVLDGSNTGGPLGHGHPRMLEGLRQAIEAPVVNETWMWVGREQAAQDLRAFGFVDEDWFGAVRFCLSGSEANDLALGLAQALTGRAALATRERAYHGASGLAGDVTVQPQWHGGLSWRDGSVDPVPRTLPVAVVPAPVGERVGPTPCDPGFDAEQINDAEVNFSDIAAVIVDYSQGGVYHSAGHQDALAARAREHGALWIADEVVNGFGRCGRWFAFQYGSSRPDIVTLGKGLGGGGAPAGAVVVSRDVAEHLSQASWQSGGTFRAHPLAMAAISTHVRVAAEADLPARVDALDGVMLGLLRDVAGRHPSVRRIDGRGLHWTVELHGSDWREWTGANARPTPAGLVQDRTLEAGALVATSGEETSLFLAPSLLIEEMDLERLVAALDHGLDAADEWLGRAA
jgi:4-aminobutyrate aminotransferase-like enzyme